MAMNRYTKLDEAQERCPIVFQGHPSLKLQGHTAPKVVHFDPIWAFPDCYFSLNSRMAKMIQKTWRCIEEVSFFSRSSVKFQGDTGQKNQQFWSELRVSGLLLQFEFTDGFEMMHNVWRSIEEVSYSAIIFRGHPSNFKVTRAEKSMIWIEFE